MPTPSHPPDRLLMAGGLATAFRSIPPDAAGAVLARHFGVSGTLTRLDTEKDDTFLVDGAHGRHIAKFSNPDENPREISLQAELLDYVAKTDPFLPVPRVVRTLAGAAFLSHVDGHGQVRLVRVLTYLDGTPLDRIEAIGEEREKVGAILARLRLAMAGFSHPHDSREIAWDVQHLPKLAFLLERIEDRDRRRQLERGLDRFRALQGRLAACRTQVLHNDFSRSNVVVDRGRAQFISGIIDFGDVVRTAIVIDLSTALLNQLSPVGSERMFDAGRDLLRGYLGVADLTQDELLLLPHMIMARVVARALITTWRAEQFPDNATYILRNTHQSWSQLDHFLSRSVDEISETFLGAAPPLSARHVKEAFPS
ncbi:phosphotransferase [Xanthobacter dioxanivorans]|uniref:Hydroxylysine kinase n=1 Tax=Xanthobacter dioxanivorans TaxID=2528964 RepID=A0A974PR21_9HYPH|nr:phosphotransferase [Xanthobacter dioxanivorans]QRG07896.1 phosphotransferase [Xanthobacter dioxanivorans]